VLTVGVGSALAVPSSHHKKDGSCKYPSLMLGLGTMSGSVKCGKPAGKGSASFSFTPSLSPPDVKYSGTFSDKFKQGTISGSFSITGALLPPGPFSGTFKITKGTGKLSKAHGSGKMKCTQTLLTMTCTQKLSKGKL
jgi:hypothetical protein